MITYRVICDIVESTYPEALQAVKNLKCLKDTTDFKATIEEKKKLSDQLAEVRRRSNENPYCNEDWYVISHCCCDCEMNMLSFISSPTFSTQQFP